MRLRCGSGQFCTFYFVCLFIRRTASPLETKITVPVESLSLGTSIPCEYHVVKLKRVGRRLMGRKTEINIYVRGK